MLSVLIYLFPSLYGEGYDLIHLLLNGNGPEDWNASMDKSLFYGHGNLLLLYLILLHKYLYLLVHFQYLHLYEMNFLHLLQGVFYIHIDM